MPVDLSNIDLSSIGTPEFAPTGIGPQRIDTPVVGPDIPLTGPEGSLRREVDRFKAGWKMESSIFNLAHVVAEPFFPMEEGFDIAQYPELYNDLPDDQREDVQQSGSLPEAQFHRDKIVNEMQTEAEFMGGGVKSAMAYKMMGILLDPTTLLGGVAEFKALHMVNKASRLTRMATGGSVMAATAATQMLPKALNSAAVDTEDVIYTMAAAAGMGAVVGSIGGVADEAVEAANSAGRKLSENVQRKMDEILVGTKSVDFEASDTAVDVMGREILGIGDEVIEGEARVALEGSELLTAQSRAIQEHAAEEMKVLNLTENTKLGAAVAKLPFSDFMLAYKLKGNMAKFYAHHILESASGIGASVKSAALLQRLNRTKLLTKVKNWRTSFAEFAKAEDVKPWNRAYWGETRVKYNKALYRELVERSQADKAGRLAEFVSDAHPSIIKQADEWQDMMSSALSLGKANGIRGLQEVVEHAGYVPLRWTGRTLNLMSKPNRTAYESLLAASYVSEGIPSKSAAKIAKSVFRRARTTDLGFDSNPGALLARDSRGMLEDMLREGGFDADEIAEVFIGIDRKTKDAGKASFARRRTSVDLTIVDQDGRSLLDIVDTDMPKMASQYASEMAGRSAYARKGIKSDGDWQAFRNAVIEDARANNPPEQVSMLVKSMDGVYNQMLGRPVGKGVAKPARRLMDWTMLTSLGQNGFAQGAETASVFAAHGVANTLKKVPHMRKLLKALRKGDMEGAGILGEFNVHLGALHEEHLLMAPNVYLEEMGQATGFLSKVDAFASAAKDKLGYWSGMNQIKSMQQKFTVTMQTDKVFQALVKGDMDDTILTRFKDLGWTDKTLAKFRKHIDNGNVIFQKNGSVDRLNLDKWDANLAEDFAAGLHKHTHQVIQSQLIGESAYWQHETIGAMMSQFRSFPLAAMEKQLVRHARIGDTESLAILAYGMACSTAVTLARAAATDVTRQDDRSALEEALTMPGIANGALRYASVLGLIPEGISMVGSVVGHDPLNATTRRGGFDDRISSIAPAFGAPTRMLKAVGGLAKVATGQRDLEKRDIRNIFGSVWLGNTLQMQQFSNLIQSTLDE